MTTPKHNFPVEVTFDSEEPDGEKECPDSPNGTHHFSCRWCDAENYRD